MKTRKLIIGAFISLSAAGVVAPAVAMAAPAAPAFVAVSAVPNSWYHM